MTERKELPAFKSEREEADWWYDNREKHAEEFIVAMAEGRVQQGGMARRLAAARAYAAYGLDRKDVSRAETLAEHRGMSLEKYLSQIVHEAIDREESAAA